MICHNLSALIGFACTPLNDEGTMAMLTTPFRFADGDPIPMFVQHAGGAVRFFDDGYMALHFSGRGMKLDSMREGKFLANAAQRNGASYTDDWILETIATPSNVQQAFANYLAAALAICAWERENEGANTDMVLLVDEVAMAYRAIYPDAEISRNPGFKGVSGKTVNLDLLVNGVGIAVTSTHHSAINAALHKIVDISQSTQNSGRKLRFVIDDREDPEKAKSEAFILQAAAEVQLLSNLERAPTLRH